MPWATMARVLDGVRIPISIVLGLIGGVLMTFAPESAFVKLADEARIGVFVIWFILGFVGAVIVLTAVLVVAEHKADQAARALPGLPAAIARFVLPASEPDPAPREIASTDVPVVRPSSDAPAFLRTDQT